MGGLWIDYESTSDGSINESSARNHQTSISRLYAGGEVDFQYHGANRLGANSLLSCLYGGKIGGLAMVARVTGSPAPEPLAESELRAAERKWEEWFQRLSSSSGDENPYRLHVELGEMMNEHVTLVRHNPALSRVLERLGEMRERFQRLGNLDGSGWANQPLLFANQLWNMLELGRVVTLGALRRDESRGAHYKPEFPARNDEKWLKTTIATHGPDGPALSYEDVDVSLVKPVARKYD
jgi:succinate dehydrogenase / fumarate reductase flavoprotein subunit